MADDRKLNLRKVIEDNARVSDLGSLASSGVKRVKVLDESTLQEMIEQAIDQVVSMSTAEERTRILADSRKQLTKLMNERDKFSSHADMVEASKNDLIQQVEKLQQELKLRSNLDEGQVAEMEERERTLQKKAQDLLGENQWLRENNDKMVEQIDVAQTEIATLKTEIARLNEEIERLQAEIARLRLSGRAGDDDLRRQLEAAQAEVTKLREGMAG